jgi:hypothetical protein
MDWIHLDLVPQNWQVGWNLESIVIRVYPIFQRSGPIEEDLRPICDLYFGAATSPRFKSLDVHLIPKSMLKGKERIFCMLSLLLEIKLRAT